MHKFFLVGIFLAITYFAQGQKLWQKQGYTLQCPVCYASDEVNRVFVPPPREFLYPLKSDGKRSEIIVFYDNFPSDAKIAFEYAVSIWEMLIDSPVPIYIQANWRKKDENVLGSCGPTDFERGFEGAPHKNIYYPIALAEKIKGVELTGSDRPDMIAEFNEDIDWYFGVDGNTPRLRYDFVSVVLHEVGHGLGFTGFFFALDITAGYSWFDWGDATSFDRMVENASGEQLIDSSIFENPSAELKSQLTSTALYANSPAAIAMGSRSRPRLYAPSTWNDGSSIYHLNDATYPSGNINTLMTHSYGRGEATHHPGPVTLGIMADMGWKNMKIEHVPLRDQEVLTPLNFEVKITSDYPVDLSQLYIVFSVDTFATTSDSIPLVPTEPNIYQTNLVADSEITSLQYYISAADTMNRVFTYPPDAPDDYFVVNFGPDDILPTIEHEPISYFFDTGDPLVLSAQVADNLGIDTVWVEYAINDIEQEPFGLTRDSGAVFTGMFPFNYNLLQDEDEVSYQIVAVDASSAGNIRRFPASDYLSFQIEKMFDPVTTYSTQFETDTNDFILNDFGIYLDEGFENQALHSPHPYPSPEEDNMELNFTSVLKHPVVLNGDANMSYDEVVLVEPGESGARFGELEFWDFVIVEGSKDRGNTWLPLAPGYDSGEHQVWDSIYSSSIADMNSTTAGSADLYIRNQINMLANGNFSEGDTILIRFRLYSDPYAYGWGWAIDNLQVQVPVSVSNISLSPGNVLVYPNPFGGSFKVTTDSQDFIDLLQFDVYNMHGQKVKSLLHKNVTGPLTSEITIENGNPGIYLLVVKENGRQVLSKKIIHN